MDHDLQKMLTAGTCKNTTFGSLHSQKRMQGRGFEQHYLGRGPGQFMGNQSLNLPSARKAARAAVPRSDRGLLTIKESATPGPGAYVTHRYESATRNSL